MIGDQIRRARIAAGMTLDDVRLALSDVDLSVTKAGLSKYELNKSVPKASTLLTIAAVLGVPSSYFMEEPEVSVKWLAFRNHAPLTKRRQDRITTFASDVAEKQVQLLRAVYPVATPHFPSPRHVCSADEAEAVALDVRRTWELGTAPIESVTQVFEDHGAIIVGWSNDGGKFDGLSGWVNGTIPISVVNTSAPDDRRRYNLAHELGHMVMVQNGHSADHEERLAHRFAAAFLAPADVARHELGARRRRLRMDELGLLKQKYGLSMQAWAHRANDLGIIDDGHYAALCREFSQRGWRKQEPIAFEGNEKPIRLHQLTVRALAEGVISDAQANRICPVVTWEPASRAGHPAGIMRVSDLLRLPEDERSRILETAAAVAESEYRTDPQLTAFDAFGDADIFDDYGSE